jgi:short subunit dehydrogenase-like uncharacterized protein
MSQPEFDVILWGATGFTGQLVAEQLFQHYGVDGDLRWAIAGRDRQKLESVRSRLMTTLPDAALPIVLADSNDRQRLDEMVSTTRVLATTVGPYALYGSELVAACARAGTDYCDLTGEVPWMAQMIARHQTTAETSGARIVHTCGFDSIPSDLGAWYVQQAMLEQHGVAATQVKGRVGRNRGAVSGGTVASMMDMLEQATKDPTVRKTLRDPYALYPHGQAPGQDGADQIGARYDQDFKQWTSPFIMAPVNTRVVRRSNALLGFPWGEDFRYDEALLAGSHFRASGNVIATSCGMLALATAPSRKVAQRVLPKPGEGPDRKQREAGHYELFFHGKHPDDESKDLRARFSGDRDPGYGSTSRMFAEAAVCLAKDKIPTAGGFWTPASALGAKLVARLEQRAGIRCEIVTQA